MKPSVAISGIGWVTPLGHTVDAVWDALLAGRSGVDVVTKFDTEGYSTRIAGEARDFDPLALMDRHDAKRLDRFSQFALASARMAVEHAGLDIAHLDPYRIGAVVGSGSGGIETTEKGAFQLFQRGPGRVSPLSVPMMMGNAGAAIVSQRLNLKGPTFGVALACSTGAVAIAQAMNSLLLGQADVMLAGGSEASVTPLSMAAFGTCGAMSRRNESPQTASRPFDKDRDGFVMAEGSAVLVLESWPHLAARGGRAIAELAGFGMTSDAYHITQPDPDSKPAARAIRSALSMADASPADVGYINAHGTSTPMNDPAEIRAVRLALGEAADRVAISSTKSMLGHMLGAAGAVEAGIAALALQHGRVPPTINVEHRDPECDLDVVPNTARDMPALNLALSNSFAFGGHNVCLALRRAESKRT